MSEPARAEPERLRAPLEVRVGSATNALQPVPGAQRSLGAGASQWAELAVDAVFEAMRHSMQRGERIELRGFGVFQVKPRKRGIGRNPRTGKEVRIPPGRTIRFKPGKELQNIG